MKYRTNIVNKEIVCVCLSYSTTVPIIPPDNPTSTEYHFNLPIFSIPHES